MAKSNKSMEDPTHDISAGTYLQVDDEHAEAEDGANCGFELRRLCEQVRVQMEKVELSLVSADTEQETGKKHIPALQSVADTITRFCAAYTELEAKAEEVDRDNEEEEEEVEGESVMMSSRKFSTETKEAEQERSGRIEEAQVDAVTTSRGKPAAPETSSDPITADECYYQDKSDAEYEEEAFALFREGWERFYSDNKISFEDLTLFSPMLFTHYTPGFKPVDAVLAKTVQVCSIKVAELKYFNWPLQVYGVVAARDAVDHRRNPIFLCPRGGCQIIDESYPFLHLTGPVRAILSEEPVDIEFQLIAKGRTASEDRPLISYAFYYEGDRCDRVETSTIENHSCTLELCTQQLTSSVQATIFGLHVVDHKSMPFENGFKVVCSSLFRRDFESINQSPSLELVLFDSKVKRKRGVKGGFINLSRQVVSVEMHGKLKVLIQAYSQSGDVAAEGHVLVVPKRCNTSQHELDLGGFKVVFTVAWSLLVEDEELILMNGMADPYALLPPMHPSLLKENGGVL